MKKWTFGVMTDHRPKINKIEANGWLNSPGSATLQCSCGWSGVKLVERWHSVEEPASSFNEPLKSFVAKWGVDQLLQDGKSLYVAANELNDLMELQVLHHLNYKPLEDKDQAVARFKLASNKFIQSFIEDEVKFKTVGEELNRAKKEVERARKRQTIWNNLTLPEPIPLKFEAQEELRKIYAAQEKEVHE